MKWNIFNIIILLGIIQGIILGISLLKSNTKANFYLALVLLFLSLTNLEYWIIDIGFTEEYLFFEYFFIPFQHLIAPMLFIYVAYFTNYIYIIKYYKTLIYSPFLIFLFIHIILMLIHFLVVQESLYIVEFKKIFYLFEEIISVLLNLFFVIQVFQLLKRYKGNKGITKNVEIDWIKNLLYIGIIISFFWIINIVFGIYKNNYISSYLLWISVSFLIYWIGYSGLYYSALIKERADIYEILHSREDHIIKEEKVKMENIFTKENPLFVKFENLIREKHLYRDPLLSLESISEELNISSGYLSQMVNKITKKNFSDYINTYRVEDIKKMLVDPEFDKYSLLAIGLEAGFNSKSSFYTVFKKHVGLTPKQYKDKNYPILK